MRTSHALAASAAVALAVVFVAAAPRRARASHRASRAFAADADTVFEAAEHAVRTVHSLRVGRAERVRLREGRALDAVFRVGPFHDDLRLYVIPREGGRAAVLHLRSTSRLALKDLGVNRARVRALFNAVARELVALPVG